MGLFLAIVTLGLVPEISLAAGPMASCFNQCQLVKLNHSKEYSLTCACDKIVSKGEGDWLAGKNSSERADFLRKKIMGISLDPYPELIDNSCRGQTKPVDPELAQKKLDIAKLPLCDCVSTIQHFPKKKVCWRTPAGEVLCEFPVEKQATLPMPVAPTLYAYQACLLKRETHQKPKSCPAKPCDEIPPTCTTGTKLVNLADPESCCPVFSCEPIEQSVEE